MLDIKYLRENFAAAEKALATRNGSIDLSGFQQLDQQRRELLSEGEALKAEKNKVSALIGRTRDKSQVQGEIARMKEVSARIKQLDDLLRVVEEQLSDLLMGLPNIPHEASPVGFSEQDNVEIRTWGEKPSFDFAAKAHWDVGEDLGILDFERASKLSGARFALYFGAGARLERALINFML
ncbi:MAG: serine--tRNA ligase, partial [Desulfuromonadales bacterium]|nr:serine--tRNA ligase [Desulfuromonadales bacterium]